MLINNNLKKDFLAIYDNAISKENCNFIIEEFERILKTNPLDIYKPIQSSKLSRSDISIYSERALPECAKLINESLNNCIKEYFEEFFVIDKTRLSSNCIKIQKTFPRGGFHNWHYEAYSREYSQRVLAWSLYLNDVPNGEGETEFLWQGVKIKPKLGRICIWPASFTHVHRGNPTYSCDKYIATGWFDHHD